MMFSKLKLVALVCLSISAIPAIYAGEVVLHTAPANNVQAKADYPQFMISDSTPENVKIDIYECGTLKYSILNQGRLPIQTTVFFPNGSTFTAYGDGQNSSTPAPVAGAHYTYQDRLSQVGELRNPPRVNYNYNYR